MKPKATASMPLTERLGAALNRRTRQVLEAQLEIQRLQTRVQNLMIENQILSYRLAEAEGDQNESHD